MNKLMIVLALCLAPCSLLLGVDEDKQFEKANNVINEIMRTPDQGVPRDLLDKALCVGIVPSELKFAIGIGGTYGRGVLVCRRGGNGAWGAPSLFTLGGANIGFQLGGGWRLRRQFFSSLASPGTPGRDPDPGRQTVLRPLPLRPPS